MPANEPIDLVEIAFPSDPGAASPNWQNVTPWLLAYSLRRGRQGQLDKDDVGQYQLTLDNSDRRFEPGYAGELANWITNPSFEINTAGWSTGSAFWVNAGATLARSPTYARRGGWSGAVTTPGTAVSEGAHFVIAPNVEVGKTYWVVGSVLRYSGGSAVSVQLGIGSAITGQATAIPALPATGVWVDFAIRFTPTGTGAASFAARSNGTVAQTFLLDGVLFVEITDAGLIAPSYSDGDWPDGRWTGTEHASQSYRGAPYYPNVVPGRRVRHRKITPASVVKNGSFESGTITGWTPSGGAYTIDSQPLDTAHGSYRLYTNARTDSFSIDSEDFIPIDPTLPYTLTAFFRQWQQEGVVYPGSFLRLWFYTKSKRSLGVGYPNTAVSGANLGCAYFNPGGVWERRGGTYVGNTWTHDGEGGIPPEAAFVKIQIFLQYTDTAFSAGIGVFVDGIMLEPGIGASPAMEGVAYDRFAGKIVPGGIPVDWHRRTAEVKFDCVDAFESAQNVDLAKYYAVQLSGARIDSVLTDIGVPAGAAYRSVATGQSEISAITLQDEPGLEHGRDVADSELGRLFVDAGGRWVFNDRRSQPPSAVAVFSDKPGPGEYPYLALTPNFGGRIHNEIRVTPAGAVSAAVAIDTASRDRYGKRVLSRQPLMTTLTEAQGQADYLLRRYKEPELEFEEITFEPLRYPKLWPVLLPRELGDRIVAKKLPPGGGTRLERDTLIESISEDGSTADGRKSWRLTFGLWPSDPTNYFKLDSSVLDGTDVLAY